MFLWHKVYYTVFTPKYRRKVIYYKLRADIQKIIKDLCRWKGIEIIEGHMVPYHIHLLLSIPPKYSVSQSMGCLKGKSTMRICQRHANLKYKFRRPSEKQKNFSKPHCLDFNDCAVSKKQPISYGRKNNYELKAKLSCIA